MVPQRKTGWVYRVIRPGICGMVQVDGNARERYFLHVINVKGRHMPELDAAVTFEVEPKTRPEDAYDRAIRVEVI